MAVGREVEADPLFVLFTREDWEALGAGLFESGLARHVGLTAMRFEGVQDVIGLHDDDRPFAEDDARDVLGAVGLIPKTRKVKEHWPRPPLAVAHHFIGKALTEEVMKSLT